MHAVSGELVRDLRNFYPMDGGRLADAVTQLLELEQGAQQGALLLPAILQATTESRNQVAEKLSNLEVLPHSPRKLMITGKVAHPGRTVGGLRAEARNVAEISKQGGEEQSEFLF